MEVRATPSGAAALDTTDLPTMSPQPLAGSQRFASPGRATAHDDQLARYQRLVAEGRTTLGDVDGEDVYPIYCKTGNHSLRDRQHAEEQGHGVFDRSDFLGVLEGYRGGNQILLDFRRHLDRWERDTASFAEWTVDGEKT